MDLRAAVPRAQTVIVAVNAEENPCQMECAYNGPAVELLTGEKTDLARHRGAAGLWGEDLQNGMTAEAGKSFCVRFFQKAGGLVAAPDGLISNALRCKKRNRDKAACARRAIGRRPGPTGSKLPHQTQEAPRPLPGGVLLCAVTG